MKATGRVNSPRNKSKPPRVSIMPPARNSGGRCGIGNGAGKPNNFWVPCTMYTKAAMILRMLKRYGDQRFIGALSLPSATDNVPQKERAVAEPVLLDKFQLQPHTIREKPFSGADDRGADEHLNFVNSTSP